MLLFIHFSSIWFAISEEALCSMSIIQMIIKIFSQMVSNFSLKDFKDLKMNFHRFIKYCKQKQNEFKAKILFSILIDMMIKLRNELIFIIFIINYLN